MHWKETLIENERIQWKRLPIKHIADGKLDIQISIPLTKLLEAQAKEAFTGGMLTMLQFQTQKQTENSKIEIADLAKLFNDCGLPEAANQFKAVTNETKQNTA